MRRPIAAVAALLAVLVLAGCQSALSETGEPLTIEQSELLAQTRFQVAASGPHVIEISIGAADDVDHLAYEVTYDPAVHAAWGTLHRGPSDLAVEEQVAFSPDTYAQLAEGRWMTGAIASAPSPVLSVVFALSADRPENAQLLRQSDARYLGATDVDGEQLQVFRMPSSDGSGGATTRLWLDEDGTMRRLDAGDDETLVISFTDEDPQPAPDGLSFGEDTTDE
ncbi:MAG TPA: hypothetical protein VN035_08520 [Microbacterium sp.]|nr:hypothetical protein [Microbacterium sp.]